MAGLLLKLGKMAFFDAIFYIHTKNASIQVTIESENKVCFNGVVCSLTAATRKIMGLAADAAIQATSYWNYGDENLMTRYNTVFPVED